MSVQHSSSGFTLIELVITVAIVALLATIVLPVAELSVQRSKESELHIALRQIRSGIDAYKRAVDEGRIIKSADESGYPKSLAALVEGVPDATSSTKSNIYFLRRIPRNPLVADPTVTAPDSWGKRSYASPPDDPQEGDDVFDVYAPSGKVGLNGIPYREW